MSRKAVMVVENWLTTRELVELHGISASLARRYVDVLIVGGLAQRTDGKRESLLFSPDAIEFLQSRIGKRGRPAGGSDVEVIESELYGLSKREMAVMRASFGIGREKASLDEVGRELKITRQRASQIRYNALRKLGKV